MSTFVGKDKFADRQYVLIGVIVLIGLVFGARLFYLQIIDEETKISAQNNSMRIERIYPDRGLIFDRDSNLLVYNEVAYDLMFTPSQSEAFDTLKMSRLLNVPLDFFRAQLVKARKYGITLASPVMKQISSTTYAKLQEMLFDFPGFHVQTRTLRGYTRPVAAHMLGYIGEVNDRILKSDEYYQSGDYVGISGIEKAYEPFLRGEKGKRIYLVDKFNRKIESYKEGSYDIPPKVGANLTTTLDADLQAYGELLMQNKIGAIVAIEPATGEILALVSSPTFDPKLLVGRVRGKNYSALATDKLKPLFNRALMAQYPPGSTFKLVNGLVGMQEGAVTETSTYPCYSGYVVGRFRIACHHNHAMAVEEAVQLSCNAYFCNAFRRTIDLEKYRTIGEGYTNWRNRVMTFGIGRKLGSDVFGELTGNVPKAEYYDKRYGKNKWKSLWVVSMGIGQGELLVTPFQMTNMTATIANRGYYITPHIVKHIAGVDTLNSAFTQKKYTGISANYFEPIINGMEKVVYAGTASSSFISGIRICGKTGTAENPHGKDHSIFTAFAPKDNPKIAISVYVENGTFGATWAAPIASLMIEKYLRDSITRPELERKILNANLIPSYYLEKKDTTTIKLSTKNSKDSLKVPKKNAVLPKKSHINGR